jgi:hypothetical protein
MKLDFTIATILALAGLYSLVTPDLAPSAHAQQVCPETKTPAVKYAIYELAPQQALGVSDANRIAQAFELVSATPVTPGAGVNSDLNLYQDPYGRIRAVFDLKNGMMEVFPDLSDASKPALPPAESEEKASRWLNDNRLLQGPALQKTRVEITTVSRKDFYLQGLDTTIQEVLRTVHFFRQLDGLCVLGPNSEVSVDVASTGVVGVHFGFRPITAAHKFRVKIISPAEAMYQLDQHLDVDLEQLEKFNNQSKAQISRPQIQISKPQLIYYEQGQIVQPVYRFVTRITQRDGVDVFNLLIPASNTAPKLILNAPQYPLPNQESRPDNAAKDITSARGLKPTLKTVELGAYITQGAEPEWISDGLAFLTEFQLGNNVRREFSGPIPPSRVAQYYWDAVWMWEPDGSTPDYSPRYVGAVNFAVHEGHGTMWSTASDSDWSKVIDLDHIIGYGKSTGKGEVTSYVLWKGCAVIPAPGDPYCESYKSPAQPSTVWFTIFQGMRGSYGFRTAMYREDDAGGAFGRNIGLGIPNLIAWFHAIDNSRWGHLGEDGYNGCPFASDPGLEYGSAVLVCKHENDTAYDTEAVPPPQCLTMWWQTK